MEKDRNLLFGILAVQFIGISPAQLVEVAAGWVTDPSVAMAQRLVEKGLLKEPDRERLEKLVDEAILAHGGDAGETLHSFGGEERVRETFYGGLNTAELDAMKTTPMTSVSYFTGSGKALSGVEETPGRYTLISHHAKGGMGHVLLVHDEYLGRNIALKELLRSGSESGTSSPAGAAPNAGAFGQTASLVARFLQEARVTGQLEHPSIVPVYELGRRQDGSIYYTMKLVNGRTLAQALRDCQNLKERLDLLPNFVDLCQAIAYAHSRGVIHRDIKPSNVMVGQFGETVVLDWGLAKVHDTEDVNMEDIEDTLHFLQLGDEESLVKTAYGRALGTPHYMPPEQAEGRVDAIGERSDVYSLGAVLYEILTGTTPYTGKNTHEVIDKVINTYPPPVLEVVPEVPQELASICEKALQKESANRYASASELAEDIQRFITGRVVSVYSYSLREILARFYRRNRATVNAALVTVLAIIAVGIFSYVNIWNARNREREQRVIAQEKTYLSQIHFAQALVGENDYASANQVLWSTDADRRGWEWSYLLNRANPCLYTVETQGTNIHGAFFSPDGKKIVTLAMPQFATIRDAETGRSLVELEGEKMYYMDCKFSPDGSKVAVAALEGIGLWDVASGKRLWKVPIAAGAYSIAFNENASLLLTGCGDKAIRVWDAASGQLVREVPTERNPVCRLRFNGETRCLVAGQGDVQAGGWTQAWRLPDFQPLMSAVGFEPSLSPDGKVIAAQDGANIVLYAADTGAPLHRIETKQDIITDLRFNHDGTRLVSASWDGSAALMDAGRGELLRKYGGQDYLRHAFFVENDRFVLTCARGTAKLTLWPADGDLPLYAVPVRGPAITIADLAPDGRHLAVVSSGQFFQVWDVSGPTGMQPLAYHQTFSPDEGGGVRELKFNASKQNLAVRWAGGRSVAAFDAAAMTTTVQYLCPQPFGAGDMALSPDGHKFVLSAGVTPVVWDIAAGSILSAYREHNAPVMVVEYGLDGKHIASGAQDGSVHVWDPISGKTEIVLEGHAGKVMAIRYSPDGAAILTASLDKSAVLWDAATGRKRATFAHAFPVLTAVFSEQGDRIATATADARVHIWNVQRAEELGTFDTRAYMFDVPDETAVSLSFAMQDRYILARCPFTNTKLWDAASFTPLATFGVTVHGVQSV